MLNNNKSEFQKNRDMLKRIKTTESIITILFMGLCFMPILLTFIMGLANIGIETLILLIDGIALKVVYFFFFANALSHKNFMKLVTATVIIACNSVLSTLVTMLIGSYFVTMPYINVFNWMICILQMILFIPITHNFSKYNYLKEQPGFPYFNDLIEQQKFDRRQFDIKNEFQQSYEKRIATSSDNMEDMNDVQSVPDNGSTSAKNKGETEMDDIPGDGTVMSYDLI